jgi:hypothetical protein
MIEFTPQGHYGDPGFEVKREISVAPGDQAGILLRLYEGKAHVGILIDADDGVFKVIEHPQDPGIKALLFPLENEARAKARAFECVGHKAGTLLYVARCPMSSLMPGGEAFYNEYIIAEGDYLFNFKNDTERTIKCGFLIHWYEFEGQV